LASSRKKTGGTLPPNIKGTKQGKGVGTWKYKVAGSSGGKIKEN